MATIKVLKKKEFSPKYNLPPVFEVSIESGILRSGSVLKRRSGERFIVERILNFKESLPEIAQGNICGVVLSDANNIAVGDVLENL